MMGYLICCVLEEKVFWGKEWFVSFSSFLFYSTLVRCFLSFLLVVIVSVLCAQFLWAVVFWVLFWGWVVVWGLSGCSSGCGCIFSTWL